MSSNLYKIPTRELVAELMRREGVETMQVAPDDQGTLTVSQAVLTTEGKTLFKAVQQQTFTGPCLVLKVLD